MKKISARRRAYDILKEITAEGKYSNLALKDGLDAELPKQDRAFITQLVYGTIEHLITIDYIISLYAKKSVKAAIKNILRLGIYQIYYLGVPDSAACNESVNLAKELGKQGTAAFINALLRNVSRDKDKIAWPDKKDIIKYLSVKYSYPQHIVRLIVNDYGADTAEKILAFEPKKELVIRANTKKITKEELISLLNDKGIETKDSELSKEAIIVENSDIINSELFAQGLFSIQSESSMLAAETVCSAAERYSEPVILDACAAPGGKTFYIKEHTKNAFITAWDVHKHRVKLIEAGMEKLGLLGINTQAVDSAKIDERYINKFDVILIDAPCSGLGVVASKPDIKYNLLESDIEAIEQLQKDILDTCSKYLRQGGVIIYSTCTILKNENERRVDAFLKENADFEKIDIKTLINIDECHMAEGYARLLNFNTAHEGFFIAGMVKH